jgi:hypothetical protein
MGDAVDNRSSRNLDDSVASLGVDDKNSRSRFSEVGTDMASAAYSCIFRIISMLFPCCSAGRYPRQNSIENSEDGRDVYNRHQNNHLSKGFSYAIARTFEKVCSCCSIRKRKKDKFDRMPQEKKE